MLGTKALVGSVVAAVCGLVYVAIWLNLSRLGDLYGPLQGPSGGLIFVVLSFVVTLVLMSALAGFTEWGSRISIPFFLLGVAAGVVVDALSDKTMDRNIFPIEAAIWCIIFGAALGIGKGLGTWFRRNRQNKADGRPLNLPTGST